MVFWDKIGLMRNKLTNELTVCGMNAVLALSEVHGEQIKRLFIRTDRLKSFSKFCKYLADQKRPYKICEDAELEQICKSPRHQGVVAIIDEPVILPLTEEDLDRWGQEKSTVLLLDSVGNDNNLGAIARSAAFFGASAIIVSDQDKEARLTTSAYRVAEGGMEYLQFRQVHNVSLFLKDAAQVLWVVGADHRARLRIRDLGPLIAEKSKTHGRRGFILVVGNEEHGLSAEVKAGCSYLARIPGTGNIESLNVAQAATLFLHELYEA